MNTFKASLILVFGLLLTQWSFSQESTTFDLNRTITIQTEDSEIKTIPFKVILGSKNIDIEIVSQIQKGDLMIEIFDPIKVKRGEFSIQSVIPQDKKEVIYSEDKKEIIRDQAIYESVSGQIKKFIKDPLVGEWFIKISPKKVAGQIKINIRFYLED